MPQSEQNGSVLSKHIGTGESAGAAMYEHCRSGTNNDRSDRIVPSGAGNSGRSHNKCRRRRRLLLSAVADIVDTIVLCPPNYDTINKIIKTCDLLKQYITASM